MDISSRTRPLITVFKQLPYAVLTPVPEIEITGVVSDSRRVQPGNLFVAYTGESVDGHRYIPAAIQRGAAAIVGTQSIKDLQVPYIQLPDSQRALAYLAAGFYDYPAQQLTMIGVTGTDGKTTTANLIFEILKAAGFQAGMISTVNAVIGEQVLDTGFHVTTPDAPDVQRYLAAMVAAGLTHAVVEVTSHGLAQYRVDACEFDIGVATNITHEHLDYHRTYESYRAAKLRLFTELIHRQPKANGITPSAVLNLDDGSYEYLSRSIALQKISYGLQLGAMIQAVEVKNEPGGLTFVAKGPGFQTSFKTSLMGKFNVSNCLAAISATVVGLGLDPHAAVSGIAALQGVPGRMERIDLGQEFAAIVDFAHTPNALRQALQAARELTTGRVIAVFGSAGLRDPAKRRMMAETSLEYADLTVFTAEDPRTESLEKILAVMGEGAVSKGGIEGKSFWRIPDRAEAIRFAVQRAKPGDVVVVCGKGHEQSMCFGEQEYLWDDRTAMRAALSELLDISGPEMPKLPTSI